VVDTNVPMTANGANEDSSSECIASSSRALHAVMTSGHLFIDNHGLIMGEYRSNLNAKGQPGPGDAFFKWLYTNEWNGQRVTHVNITPKTEDPHDFDELPKPAEGIKYDRSDRKFLAVAASHPEHPPILQ
jgi:hypothetical protein